MPYDGCAEFHAENIQQLHQFMAEIHNSEALVGELVLFFISKAGLK